MFYISSPLHLFDKLAVMLYPELPIGGFLAAALVLVPLPRQIRARNIATIALVFWFFEQCLVSAINAIIWAGNVNNPVPHWCDIGESSHLCAAQLKT